MTTVEEDALLTINQAKMQLPMSAAWFRQQIFRKKIKYLKVGGRVFIPQSAISELLKRGLVEPQKREK